MTKEERLARQGGRCAYCRKEIEIDAEAPDRVATWDEIIPRARGGTKVRWNRVVACLPCNHRKGSRDVREFAPGWAPDPMWSISEYDDE